MSVRETVDSIRTALGWPASSKAMSLVSEFEKETRAAGLARRQALASERADVAERQLAAIAAHGPRAAAADSAIADARRALDAALAARAALEHQHRGGTMAPLDRRRDQIEHELRQTASPLIAEFRASLQLEVEAAIAQQDVVRAKKISGGFVDVWDNGASIGRRVQAIQASWHDVEPLIYEALAETEIDARLIAIRAAWPVVDGRPEQYSDMPSAPVYA